MFSPLPHLIESIADTAAADLAIRENDAFDPPTGVSPPSSRSCDLIGGEDAVRQFLTALFGPDDLIEFQFVETWGEAGRKKSTRIDRRFFSRTEAIAHLAGWAERNSEPTFENVSAGVCPRPGLNAMNAS